ncbi:MAG: lytic transglycosylase domain-containing protein [Caldimonas sp.]
MLSNFMSPDTSNIVVAAPSATPAPALSREPVAAVKLAAPQMRQLLESVAVRSAVSSDLLHAVIAAESNFNARAVSPKGALGLMQLMPATAKRFGAADPFDPEQNIAAGASYLKWLMAIFRDDIELVLAAYNAGEQAVIKAGHKIPPYPETQAYVKKVMASLRRPVPANL